MLTRIEDGRWDLRMSKEQISRELGITSKTYRGYVNGTPIPSDVLVKMCDMFGCSTDYLLGLTDNHQNAS